ncbi:MAG: glycoside hydrolase family 43 protein [Fimbriimonadaceae bacterium]|nr:glycoside hydrolase family 43 protein [Fimbriimonadaceae bacterium]
MTPQSSGNPLFPGWWADPEIHVFDGRYYIYPTFSAAYEDQTFFDVWSSSDLTGWRNEGRILDFANVPWSTNRAAWAPSVTYKNGPYFLYFSAGDGAGIGVAQAEHPAGPFFDVLGKPLIEEYHHGAQPIDAHAFIDDDGKAYLYYGGWKHAVVVELGEDMVSTVGEFREITPENYVEGPFMLKRNGVYYFMWSEGGWGDPSYSVAYARSDSPFGPFVREGVVLKSDPEVATSAGHHSVLQIPGTDEWVICYHRRPLTESARDHRVVCLDWMEFDEQGRILPVKLTKTGVSPRPLVR